MLRRPPRPTPFPYTTLFRSLAELDHGRADLNPAARRQVGAADVEIDIELVACIRPTVSIPRHRRRCPRVHERQLGIWIRTTIRGVGASSNPPGVALQTIVDIKPGH